MRLYDLSLSPYAARCRLAIFKKGLDIEIVAPPEGGPRSEAYRAINPLRKVPALVLDDGTVIPESAVIVEYLEDRFPEPSLRPASPEALARARLLVRVAELHLIPPFGRLIGQRDPAGRDPVVVEGAKAEIAGALAHLEHFLAAGDGFAAGPGFSIADCGLMPLLFGHTRIMPMFGDAEPLGGDRYPKLRAYWRRLQADPVVARVGGEMGEGLKRMFGGN